MRSGATPTAAQKRRWLYEVEALAAEEIFHTTVSPFSEVGSEPLLAPAAYADLYLKFLEAQMHFHNGDFARYNNAMSLFSSLYAACAASRTRAELPDAGARVRL